MLNEHSEVLLLAARDSHERAPAGSEHASELAQCLELRSRIEVCLDAVGTVVAADVVQRPKTKRNVDRATRERQ